MRERGAIQLTDCHLGKPFHLRPVHLDKAIGVVEVIHAAATAVGALASETEFFEPGGRFLECACMCLCMCVHVHVYVCVCVCVCVQEGCVCMCTVCVFTNGAYNISQTVRSDECRNVLSTQHLNPLGSPSLSLCPSFPLPPPSPSPSPPPSPFPPSLCLPFSPYFSLFSV